MRKNKSLFDSFSNALHGVIHALVYERNFRVHFALAFLILLLSLFLDLSLAEYLIVVLTIALVLITELINTAIEAVVDLYAKDRYYDSARVAKDVAAGAVFLSAAVAVIVGYLIIFTRLMEMGFSASTIMKIRQTPVQITLVCTIITVMLTIVIKAFTNAEHFFKGGMPSAHSALAFSLATCIFFMVDNSLAIFLSFFLAFLVAQSRVEGRIHSLIQVVVGSLLGIFVTTLIFQLYVLD